MKTGFLLTPMSLVCQKLRKTSTILLVKSLESVSTSPFLERLSKKGYEVLFLVDAIDEYAVQQSKEFDGKSLTSITKVGLTLEDTEEEKKAFEEVVKSHETLCSTMKEILGDQVEKVVLSNRMTRSPCCLVTGEYGWSANMERIMKSQALGDSQNQSYMMSKKTMELNPDHRIVRHYRNVLMPIRVIQLLKTCRGFCLKLQC